MSISSTGAATGAGNLSQLLASMLSRIKSATTSDTATTAPPSPTADTQPIAQTTTDTTTLSDQVIGALVMMQAQGSDPSQAATSSSGNDPVSQAFAGLDSNGDGSISQSELETAITSAGGTASEADTVYTALGGTDQSGVSQASFTSAAQAGAPPGGSGGAHGHHHHHHSGGAESASSIFQTLDSNQDGSVSADELSAALGGTSDASGTPGTSSEIFSAIDSNADGSVSQNELGSYLDNLQKQAGSDQTTLNAFQQLANQSYNTSLGLMASAASNQMATA
ncbi:MAG: Calerythrin [Alphaproteobacteria bacterium]|jgi:Ca2+-binding EF-hand superfamily protein|nr:Calerythrin [Alphaproteobacteria bacterium]MDB5740664.1 Calerythrin [Alphaproteobacteria bacterium]